MIRQLVRPKWDQLLTCTYWRIYCHGLHSGDRRVSFFGPEPTHDFQRASEHKPFEYHPSKWPFSKATSPLLSFYFFGYLPRINSQIMVICHVTFLPSPSYPNPHLTEQRNCLFHYH